MNLYLLKAKCITFFCCLLFAQTVLFAQSNVKITIKKNEITLREALTEVEKQSKMSVAYNESQLGGSKRISLNVSELPLEQALKVILKGTGFSYKLKDNSGKKGRVCIKGNTRSGCGRTRRSLDWS